MHFHSHLNWTATLRLEEGAKLVGKYLEMCVLGGETNVAVGIYRMSLGGV